MLLLRGGRSSFSFDHARIHFHAGHSNTVESVTTGAVMQCVKKRWLTSLGGSFILIKFLLKKSQRYEGLKNFRVLNTSSISF